jgi:hypothetical protein
MATLPKHPRCFHRQTWTRVSGLSTGNRGNCNVRVAQWLATFLPFYVSFWLVCFPEIRNGFQFLLNKIISNRSGSFLSVIHKLHEHQIIMDTTMLHFQFPLSLVHVSYHCIMRGSISLSDVTELKCTNLEDYLKCIKLWRLKRTPTAHRNSSGRAVSVFRLGYENQSGVTE